LKEAQELSTVEPRNPRYRRSVAVGYAKVGDIYYETHDFKTAGINFQTSFSILKVLSDNEPNNMQLRRSLGLIDARVALTEMKAGNLVEAINTNRQTIEIQRQISVADPNNLQIRYDLAATLGNLGECYGMVRSFDLAEQTFQEAIAISKQALAKDPTYAQARMNFAVNYVMYAQMLQKSGDPSRALANYQNARKIYEEEPLRSESAEQLAELYEGIGDSLLMLDRSAKNIGVAKTMYQQTLEALVKLQDSGKLNQENINKPGEISRKITRCDTIMESISSSR
jgi:tetratricopeptide (TPR) repeat protein